MSNAELKTWRYFICILYFTQQHYAYVCGRAVILGGMNGGGDGGGGEGATCSGGSPYTLMFLEIVWLQVGVLISLFQSCNYIHRQNRRMWISREIHVKFTWRFCLCSYVEKKILTMHHVCSQQALRKERCAEIIRWSC